MGKVHRGQRALGGELHTRLAPVQPPRDHQVQYQPEIVLQADGDALAHTPQFPHRFPLDGVKWWRGCAEQKRTRDPHALEPLIQDARLESFHVHGDVGEFRHDFAILT